jgi:hypothetical protein
MLAGSKGDDLPFDEYLKAFQRWAITDAITGILYSFYAYKYTHGDDDDYKNELFSLSAAIAALFFTCAVALAWLTSNPGAPLAAYHANTGINAITLAVYVAYLYVCLFAKVT